MTFKEFFWYQRWQEDSEKREWQRLSTLMSLNANMNASKGKTFSPDDFNPYAQKKPSKGGQLSSMTEAKNLAERMKAKTFS